MIDKSIFDVILSPIVTEKSTSAGERENSIAFWVRPKATKAVIKRAVETFFKVEVVSVRTSNKRSTDIVVGKTRGRTMAKKKAYVKLSPGHQITLHEQ